jgi:hypothetical protein
MKNGAEADRMILNAIPADDLNSELEKLKEENEKLKLTHTKIEEEIKKYTDKQRKIIVDNDDSTYDDVDHYKRDMAEASLDIVENVIKEIMGPDYKIKKDPVLFTHCKYFDELGVKDYFTNWFESDDRVEEWRKEREEYGFDSRETWSIYSVLIDWIYSRFRRYKEVCDADLDWRGWDDCLCFPFKENGEEKLITQREAIDFVLGRCEEYIKGDSDDKSEFLKLFDDDFWVLFGKLLPAMWW